LGRELSPSPKADLTSFSFAHFLVSLCSCFWCLAQFFLVYTDGSYTTGSFGKCGAAAVSGLVTAGLLPTLLWELVRRSLLSSVLSRWHLISGVSRTLLSGDVQVGVVMIFSDCRTPFNFVRALPCPDFMLT
jgi:hypothetical protein